MFSHYEFGEALGRLRAPCRPQLPVCAPASPGCSPAPGTPCPAPQTSARPAGGIPHKTQMCSFSGVIYLRRRRTEGGRMAELVCGRRWQKPRPRRLAAQNPGLAGLWQSPGPGPQAGLGSCTPRCQAQGAAWRRQDAFPPCGASSCERAGLVWGGGCEARRS